MEKETVLPSPWTTKVIWKRTSKVANRCYEKERNSLVGSRDGVAANNASYRGASAIQFHHE